MAEHTVHLRKDCGGATIAGIAWPEDGSVAEVPYDLALELLAIPDGDFSVLDGEPDPLPGRPKRPRRKTVTEPAPAAEAAVTEPAPAAEAPAAE